MTWTCRPWPTRPEVFQTYLGLPIANMLSSRGCYGRCSFCSIRAWYRQNPGKELRQRSAADVAREMAALYHDRGIRIFNFHDDNFFLPRAADNVRRFRDLKDRLDALAVGRIAIQVKARPDSVEPAVLAALVDLGLLPRLPGRREQRRGGPEGPGPRHPARAEPRGPAPPARGRHAHIL